LVLEVISLRCAFALTTSLLLVALAAPPLTAQTTPAIGRDTVVIGLDREPDTLNTIFSCCGQSPGADEMQVHSTLFIRDVIGSSSGIFVPQGVEGLPNVRDGTWRFKGEGVALTWRLRPRRWHDGPAVTCADYVFSHQVIRRAFPGLAAFNVVTSVSCPAGPGGRDILVTHKSRSAWASAGILFFGGIPLPGPIPRHKLEEVFRRNPEGLRRAAYGNDSKETVGDGAYRLTEWRRGVSITVEAVDPPTILGRPKVRRIIWRFMDRQALRAALLAGTIDAIGILPLSPAEALSLEGEGRGRIRVLFEPGAFWEHIDFNLDNPLLRDVRIRRAIAHAVNRTEIAQRVGQGKYLAAHAHVPLGHPAFTTAAARYPYDPARARSLLAAAGFTPGPDGVVRNAAGERLALQLNTTTGIAERELVEEIVQQQLRQVGIDVMIENFPSRIFFSNLFMRRYKALALFAWSVSPRLICALFRSGSVPREETGWSGVNFSGYRSAEFDRACDIAEGEMDAAARNGLLREAVKVWTRDLPALPLYFIPNIAAAKVGLGNFRPWWGATGTWNAHEWYWR
jgi:peptide/nickel transport system substrate-binding protein